MLRTCNAFVRENNAKCQKNTLPFINYCWRHYTKITSMLLFFLGVIFTLTFSEPLTWSLSKIPFMGYIDKNPPVIDKITPDLRNVSVVDKKTASFTAVCYDKDSGLSLSNSYIKISYRNENQQYIPIIGKLDKSRGKLIFAPEKELDYGEYLFERKRLA